MEKTVVAIKKSFGWNEGTEAALGRHLRAYGLPSRETQILAWEQPGEVASLVENSKGVVHVVFIEPDDVDLADLFWLYKRLGGDRILPVRIWQNPDAIDSEVAPGGWIWHYLYRCYWCGRAPVNVMNLHYCNFCRAFYCKKHAPDHSTFHRFLAGKELDLSSVKYWELYYNQKTHPYYSESPEQIFPFRLALKRAERLARQLSKTENILSVWLYGSVARGESLMQDIDLLVVVDQRSAFRWLDYATNFATKETGYGEALIYLSPGITRWIPGFPRGILRTCRRILHPYAYTKEVRAELESFGELWQIIIPTHVQLWPAAPADYARWLEGLRTRAGDWKHPSSIVADALRWNGTSFAHDQELPGREFLPPDLSKYSISRIPRPEIGQDWSWKLMGLA